VERSGERTKLEWVADSDYRFFPTVADDLFGHVLHPVDLATNKAMAAADRREVRDSVDLVTIHENHLAARRSNLGRGRQGSWLYTGRPDC